MTDLRFDAPVLLASGAVVSASHRIRSRDAGFVVERPELGDLELGPGYRLLETLGCGVCATDLARPHLPFPLPQIVGHEVLARDERGRRVVVEINASCLARRLAEPCPTCRAGLSRHCEERMTLGIDRLPGGFGPFVLAPEGAIVPVPDEIDDDTALLTEPFAAALQAVDSSTAGRAEEIVVLGPRRLGMLIVAALAARRREGRVRGRIRAIVRREALGELAVALGADRFEIAGADPAPADLVFETSGNPRALDLALGLARRELHLKSTHGRAAGGLDQLTALVVDELGLARLGEELALPDAAPAGILLSSGGRVHAPAEDELAALAAAPRDFGRLAVVRDDGAIDRVIRPMAGLERALVAPRATILLDPRGRFTSPIGRAVLAGLRLTSSRCGDFRRALELLRRDERLRALGRRFVSHRLPRTELARAFALAASPDSLKVVVE